MLERVGFFTELAAPGESGYDGGGIHDAMRARPHEREAEIVEYLAAGHLVLALMEGAPDVVTGKYGSPEASGAPSLLSDGAWVCRLDLAHDVRTYHVELPDQFYRHVESNGYRVPAMERYERIALAEELTAHWRG